MTNKETRCIQAQELRAQMQDGVMKVKGYGAVFNSPSVDLGFIETISLGAFTRTLRENPDVLLLRSHDAKTGLLARTTAGTLTLTQDAKGLYFEATLPNTENARDTYENLRVGNLDSCSFGFSIPTGGDKWDNKNGTLTRQLLDIDLAEVSITSFAAYPATSASVRSCPPELRSLLSRRSNDVGCDCDCESCLDNDCGNCSMEDCTDAECRANGCPNQDEDRRRYMRLQIALRK